MDKFTALVSVAQQTWPRTSFSTSSRTAVDCCTCLTSHFTLSLKDGTRIQPSVSEKLLSRYLITRMRSTEWMPGGAVIVNRSKRRACVIGKAETWSLHVLSITGSEQV